MVPVFYSAGNVASLLDFPGCTAAVRRAMAGLSADSREQPLRMISEVASGQMLAAMPGMAGPDIGFGAKVVSVFPSPTEPTRGFHRGAVLLFDQQTGELLCLADAHEVTRIRTACASAAASLALARPGARRLAIFGTGTQAQSHLQAFAAAFDLDRVNVWGRSPARSEAFAEQMAGICEAAIRSVDDPREAAQDSDIICTVTSAREPILRSEWVRPGTHVNLVGSSYAGPVEVDGALVARSAYFVDYEPSARAAAAEFIDALAAGEIGSDHIAGEIGRVYAGEIAGRSGPEEVTVYKSLGHVVQDLAAVDYLHRRARSDNDREGNP